jgi:hypothetical protein
MLIDGDLRAADEESGMQPAMPANDQA